MPPQRKTLASKTASPATYASSGASSTVHSGNLREPPLPATPGLSHSRFALIERIAKRHTSLAERPPPDWLEALENTFIGERPIDDSSTDEGAGTLVPRRRVVEGLNTPVATCIGFAKWLKNHICVEDEALLRAIERDGSDFLRLASATIVFDSALRGKAPPINGVGSTLIEHAEMLSTFAELLKSKILEDSLSEELAAAVLRDGVSLFRLAKACVKFDLALRGSGSAEVK